MKAAPVKHDGQGFIQCEAKEATHVYLKFHNESSHRHMPIQIGGTRQGTGNWSWNGDTEKPTLKPSILLTGTIPPTDDECDRILAGEKLIPKPLRCHVWINDGKVKHLADCLCGLKNEIHNLSEVTIFDTP